MRQLVVGGRGFPPHHEAVLLRMHRHTNLRGCNHPSVLDGRDRRRCALHQRSDEGTKNRVQLRNSAVELETDPMRCMIRSDPKNELGSVAGCGMIESRRSTRHQFGSTMKMFFILSSVFLQQANLCMIAVTSRKFNK